MRKIMIITAALAGSVVASHAAITALNFDGNTSYDGGAYEVFSGSSSNGTFNKSLSGGYLGQTVTTSNAFDLGAITIVYSVDGDISVSNLVLEVYEITDPNAGTYTIPPASIPLFSGTFDAPAPNGADTLYLSLNTNISLSANSYYMILLNGEDASSEAFDWMRSGSSIGNFYDDGQDVYTADRDFLVGLGLAPEAEANDDEYILPLGDSSLSIAAPGVLANDLGYDSAVLVSNISTGSLTFNADGSFSCSDLANGSNTFSYAVVSGSETSAPATVLLFVILAEDPPVAVDDTYVMDLAYGGHIEGNVLNNDTNNSVIFEMFAMEDDYTVANGTLTGPSNDGEFFYIPDDGFTGTATFTYKAYAASGTSAVATVTLIIESNAVPGTVIDSFETYDNSTTVDVRDLPDASANWDPFGSGLIEIIDLNGYGPSYQRMVYGYNSGFRGAVSKDALFSGIPKSSTEYWLYCEMYPSHASVEGNFGVTTNLSPTVSTSERGDYSVGVRFSGDGVGNITLYAFTGGGASNDVLLATGLNEDVWYGVWMNINNAANTYDVYLGDAGNPGNLGSRVGADIVFDAGSADLARLLVSSRRFTHIDNIMNLTLGAASYYGSWASDHGLINGVNDAYGDDPESDGMNNLIEYALGGDPLSNDTADVRPEYGVNFDGSDQFFDYIYRRRIDYAARGLTYTVGSTWSLVFEQLTNATVEVGSGIIDAEFESVTNRISMEVETKQFIGLKISIEED
ncbi:MAG: Ig-like domain-containing protein [Pontiella sp.]